MKFEVRTFPFFLISLWLSYPAGAGTTQIYSPSGLSPNSAPELAPPVAPPPEAPATLPQSLEFAPIGTPLPNSTSTSSTPNSTNSPDLLQETIVKDIWPGQPQNNSIESFFQLKQKPHPTAFANSNSTTTRPAPVHKNNSLPANFGRLLWHILDNAGIPMNSEHDSTLDPSLVREVARPATKPPTMPISQNGAVKAPDSLDRLQINNHQGTPQKIPQSELEGFEVPPNNDNQNIPH